MAERSGVVSGSKVCDDGTKLWASKSILAMRSKVFAAMFLSSSFKESQSASVNIKNMTPTALRQLLRYGMIYMIIIHRRKTKCHTTPLYGISQTIILLHHIFAPGLVQLGAHKVSVISVQLCGAKV